MAAATSRSPPTTADRWTRSTGPRSPRGDATTVPRGRRPEYSDGYYGAFVFDPDGYNVEAVYHADD